MFVSAPTLARGTARLPRSGRTRYVREVAFGNWMGLVSLEMNGVVAQDAKRNDSHQRDVALGQWDNEGGPGPRRKPADGMAREVSAGFPQRASAELVQLRVRMIALDDRLAFINKGSLMTYRIAILLFMLWLLGLVYAYTMGGLIHVLPVIALVLALMQYVRTRPAT